MMGVKCFMVRETNRWQLRLRRYSSKSKCEKNGYHNAYSKVLDTIESKPDSDGIFRNLPNEWDRADARWPRQCKCGYVFVEGDEWQLSHDELWVDDTGKEYTMRKMPPGAMWFADWLGASMKGPDGHALCVVCPDGKHWVIDGPASNCTKPDDRGPYGQAHRCWVRHGVPPYVSVDKNGKTCSAGAGSIDTKFKYHGFLGSHGAQPGYFT